MHVPYISIYICDVYRCTGGTTEITTTNNQLFILVCCLPVFKFISCCERPINIT